MKLTAVLATLRDEHRRLAAQVATLDTAIGALSRLGGGSKARTMSAAGRARIAASQRARWAKVKRQKVVSIAQKRTMSSAARKRVVAAQKARWAKWRKEHR